MNFAKFLVLTFLVNGSTALAQTPHQFELIPKFTVSKCEFKADGSGGCDLMAPSPSDPLFVDLTTCFPYATGEICFGSYSDKIAVDTYEFEASVSITRTSNAAGDIKHDVQVWISGPTSASATTRVTVEGNRLRDPIEINWNAMTVPGATPGDQTYYFPTFSLGVN